MIKKEWVESEIKEVLKSLDPRDGDAIEEDILYLVLSWYQRGLIDGACVVTERIKKGSEMTDFTKEELKEIKRCLKYMINGGITPYSLLTMDIKKKIQSLIDNYCNHDEKFTDYDVNPERCRKCLRILDED